MKLLNTRDHQDYMIIKIGQNPEKSPGDLRRLTVTQTLVKIHQLTQIRETNTENGLRKQTCTSLLF